MGAATATPTKPSRRDLAPAEAAMLHGECDGRGCPAPAMQRVDLYGQDFYFCNHHWGELPAEHRDAGGQLGEAADS